MSPGYLWPSWSYWANQLYTVCLHHGAGCLGSSLVDAFSLTLCCLPKSWAFPLLACILWAGSAVSSSTALPCSEARSALPYCLSIPLAPCCLLLGAGCLCCSHFFSLFQSPRCCLHIPLPTRFQLSPVPLSLTPSPCTPTLYHPFSPLLSPGTSGFSSNPFSTIKLKRAVFQTFLHAFQLLEAFNCCLFPFMIYCCSWCVRIHLQRKLLLYFMCAVSGRL